jgi:hypothetical protein
MTVMTEPHALTVAWLRSLFSGTAPHISTQLDPARGFPQLVVTLVQAGTPTLSDGRPDPAVRTLAVAVTAVGTGGDRPDFAGAWSAISPVIDAAEALAADPFEAAGGERLVNANGVITSRATDPDTGAATYTATFGVTFTLPA